MNKLENKTIKFRCHKCGYYYKAMAKLCTLERQKISDEFEILIFGKDCPNCRCLNRELDPEKHMIVMKGDNVTIVDHLNKEEDE